jgi:tetratricopeptide (TPR) repeat protein
VLTGEKTNENYALSRRYENPLVDRFEASVPVGVAVRNHEVAVSAEVLAELEKTAWASVNPSANDLFLRALYENAGKLFNSSLNYYTQAIDKAADEEGVEKLYEGFYRMNRGVLRAEMIDFISSIENNVQVLSMDDAGTTRARVRDQVTRQYDYSEAIDDMKAAQEVVPDIPYVYYNLGNLYCLSSEHINSIDNYTKAIELYPYMGDAYFNRGLVLIYLKDKEKGCIDLSSAGELGVQDAYGVIKKYCEDENN